MGQTTAGHLSGRAAFVELPCGLTVRVSPSYLCTADGTPVEGRGIVPDVPVEWTIDDVLSGRDPDLSAALQLLGR